MNKLWVRISLTYIAIVIFLFLIPTVVFLAVPADALSSAGGQGYLDSSSMLEILKKAHSNILGAQRLEIVSRLVRVLLGTSLVGILVGTISSLGLSAPLHNLSVAARAVGSQDLSQRIEVRGSSEVREVAEAFNAMAAALEEAEKLRSNMLADITHELRTPLTVIQGNLRAILDDVYRLDKVEVARLYDQTRQLSRLVDDLHDLALLEANQFSLTMSEQDLRDIVNDVAAIYQPIFDDQQIALSLQLPEKIPAVIGDSSRIAQCLNNLLNNALRHTSPGGSITISVTPGDTKVALTVTDNGSGIAKEHLPYIFDRFYRTESDRNRQSGGSGLGLAITQALVKAHGGEITVSSPGLNQGSTFTMVFPAGA